MWWDRIRYAVLFLLAGCAAGDVETEEPSEDVDGAESGFDTHDGSPGRQALDEACMDACRQVLSGCIDACRSLPKPHQPDCISQCSEGYGECVRGCGYGGGCLWCGWERP